jgi:ABC-type Na+ efflux pump permease subunit
MNNKNNTPLVALIVVLAVLVIGGIGYIIFQASSGKSKQTATTQDVSSPSPVATDQSTDSSPSPALKTTGNTDADLNADVNDVDTDLKAVDSEQTSADQGLNDKQTDLSS